VHEFAKSRIIYNLHRLQKAVKELMIVEGLPSVWWLDQAGFCNVVALMGSSCSEEQAAIIARFTTSETRIAVMPDRDDAGERFAHSAFERLGVQRWMRWTGLQKGKQPTAYCREDLNRMLCM